MITKESTLEEILKYPEAHIVLAEFGVPCLTCPMASLEMSKLKIGEICETYGIDCEKLIKRLNEIIENERNRA
jgi:hybrid cluster-associated redox disulfide protein